MPPHFAYIQYSSIQNGPYWLGSKFPYLCITHQISWGFNICYCILFTSYASYLLTFHRESMFGDDRIRIWWISQLRMGTMCTFLKDGSAGRNCVCNLVFAFNIIFYKGGVCEPLSNFIYGTGFHIYDRILGYLNIYWDKVLLFHKQS